MMFKKLVKLNLEALEDRLCMSGGLPATPATPPPSLNSPGPDVSKGDIWNPPAPGLNDYYATASNWSEGVVPSGSTAACFNGTYSATSDAPCIINVNDLYVSLNLSGGYDSGLYVDGSRITITGYIDSDYANDELALVDNTNLSSINFGTSVGTASNFVFGNLMIAGPTNDTWTVNFLPGSNSSLGENPSGGNCTVSIQAPGGINVTQAQLNIGDCNGNGSSTVSVDTPTITVQGSAAVQTTSYLNFYGNHSGASILLTATGTDGTTIKVGGINTGTADLYLVNQDPNFSNQTLSNTGIVASMGGTLVSATGGEWSAYFVTVTGGTMQIGTNSGSNPTPTFTLAEGLGEDVNNTSSIKVESNCNFWGAAVLNMGALTFYGTYVMDVSGGNVTLGPSITVTMVLSIPEVNGQYVSSEIDCADAITLGGTLYMEGVGDGNPTNGEQWLLMEAGGITGSFKSQQESSDLEPTDAAVYDSDDLVAYYTGP